MKVSELLDRPEKWTKKAFARDNKGLITKKDSPDATCWCLVGAICKCYPDNRLDVICKIYQIGITNIPMFNDDSTYEEVMNLVKELDI